MKQLETSTRHPWSRAAAWTLLAVALSLAAANAAHAQNPCSAQLAHTSPLHKDTGATSPGLWNKLLSWLGVQSQDPPVAPGGIGGTGIQTARPGLGGTGISGDGIGGTGIVGVITGFASICVNDLEVQFDKDTPLSDNGQPAALAQLAVGQIVSIRAQNEGDSVVARHIAVMHAAVGPLDAVDHATGEFKVLGQAARAFNPADVAQLEVGDWVRVSGHRLALGEIAASRIEAIPPAPQVQLMGTVRATDGTGFSLEGTPVRLDKALAAEPFAPGTEVLVRGVWNGISLQADQVQSNPTSASLGAVRQVVAEGYIRALTTKGMSLGHTTMALDPHVQVMGGTVGQLAVNQRVQIRGQVGADLRITVERIEFRSGGGRGSGGSGDDGADSPRGSGTDDSSGRHGGSDDSGGSGKSGSTESGSSGKTESSGSSGSSGRSSNSGSSGSSGSSGGGKK